MPQSRSVISSICEEGNRELSREGRLVAAVKEEEEEALFTSLGSCHKLRGQVADLRLVNISTSKITKTFGRQKTGMKAIKSLKTDCLGGRGSLLFAHWRSRILFSLVKPISGKWMPSQHHISSAPW